LETGPACLRLRHLVNLVHDLTGRGVGLKVLADQGTNLDTTTANHTLGLASKFLKCRFVSRPICTSSGQRAGETTSA